MKVIRIVVHLGLAYLLELKFTFKVFVALNTRLRRSAYYTR